MGRFDAVFSPSTYQCQGPAQAPWMAALTDAYQTYILSHMRTTIILKDDILKKAQEATGIKEKTGLIHMGLEALIRQAAIERLIKMGGTDKKAKVSRRRRD